MAGRKCKSVVACIMASTKASMLRKVPRKVRSHLFFSTFASEPDAPSLQKPFHGKGGKAKATEGLAASPYAMGRPKLFFRSMSVPKLIDKSQTESSFVAALKEKTKAGRAYRKTSTPLCKMKVFKGGRNELANRSSVLKDRLSESQSFNSSFSASMQLPVSESPVPANLFSQKSLKAIEATLTKALQTAALCREETQVRKCEMKAYQQAFTDVAEIAAGWRSLLLRIKNKYETWLEDVEKCEREVTSLQTLARKESEEKATLLRKFERVSRENGELSSACETYRAKCFQYQKKLIDLSSVQLTTFPPTEEAWKSAMAQLSDYRETKKSLKTSEAKQRKLLNLIAALKTRGYPVEEVYNDVKGCLRSEKSKPSTNVPILPLTPIEDSESGLDSYEVSLRKALDSSRFSEKTEKGQELVPKIRIPENKEREDHGFQQEFMALYDEFSESWRRQIDAQKHQ